jgi:hypothetical protein
VPIERVQLVHDADIALRRSPEDRSLEILAAGIGALPGGEPRLVLRVDGEIELGHRV